MDAFRSEISPNSWRERLHHWSLRCSAHFGQRDLCLSRRITRRSLGTPARFHHLQPRFDYWLCTRPADPALGRGHCRNVLVSLLDLFLSPGHVLARRRHRCGQPILDGDRGSDGDKARADDGRAANGWNLDRSLRRDPGSSRRAYYLDPARRRYLHRPPGITRRSKRK